MCWLTMWTYIYARAVLSQQEVVSCIRFLGKHVNILAGLHSDWLLYSQLNWAGILSLHEFWSVVQLKQPEVVGWAAFWVGDRCVVLVILWLCVQVCLSRNLKARIGQSFVEVGYVVGEYMGGVSSGSLHIVYSDIALPKVRSRVLYYRYVIAPWISLLRCVRFNCGIVPCAWLSSIIIRYWHGLIECMCVRVMYCLNGCMIG